MLLPKRLARKIRSRLRPANTDPLRVLHRDDLYASGPPVDACFGDLLEFVAANAGPRVLDIGCGLAPYVAALNQRGFQAEGIELDPDCVAGALALGRPVKRMDATKLAYEDNSFDSCVLIDVIEHLDHYEKALREAARVARHNLLISVPSIDSIVPLVAWHVIPRHMLEPSHVNFFTLQNLQHLLHRLFPQARCVVEGYSPFFAPMTEVQLFYQLRALVDFTGGAPAVAAPETVSAP